MEIPRIGVGVPSCGPHAGPDAIVSVATAAERLGYDSVWTFERLLLPAPAVGDNPYGLPVTNASVYDPLDALTWVAAHTQRVRLGTNVLDSLFHPPVVLAKRLATLDQCSSGRVVAGIGQGWMPEEFTAVGVPQARRGNGFEEHLAAMRACWAPDPVEYEGRYYKIARSQIGPKPVDDRVPVLIGGTTQPAVERAARLGDGFATVFMDWDTTRTHIDWYRSAGGTGAVVLRVNAERVGATHPTAPFTGTPSSLIDDFARAATIGVDDLLWDLNPLAALEPQRQVDALEALAAALGA
jgi:probable F420-dependent oxidoreductase